MESINDFINKNRQRILDELFDFIRIPSISTKPEHKQDMFSAAEYLKTKLIEAGVQKATVMPTEKHPVVYAEQIIDKSLPTVLIYGHYDVQPVEPLELWTSPPFEPEIRDEKIYARGADDDKGQLFMHVKALEYMNSTSSLPCNVKFMIEGEEEIGSPSLGQFCKDNTEMLKSDIILISDTTMIANDVPSITVGLRGLSAFEIEVTGANRDLHSGLFGGAVANPINILTKIIAQLTDKNNKIAIPGFYDDVVEFSESDRKEMAKAPFSQKEYNDAIEISKENGEKGYTTRERVGIRPSLDVNGIWGGYSGDGIKTVLPSKAYAKISMRLVANQEAKKIDKLFEKYVKQICPEGVSIKITPLHGGNPYSCPSDIKAYKAAKKAMNQTFQKQPIPFQSGGSIPIVSLFEEVLGVKSLLMGFGLESDAIHSPNENYPLFNFFKGIETIPLFYTFYINEK